MCHITQFYATSMAIKGMDIVQDVNISHSLVSPYSSENDEAAKPCIRTVSLISGLFYHSG